MSASRNSRKSSVTRTDSSQQKGDEKAGATFSSKPRARAGSGSKENGVQFGSIDKAYCGTCKKICNDDDQAMECEMCERWFHKKCQGVSDKLYEALVEDKGVGLIHWYCNSSCNLFARKFMTSVGELHKDIVKVKGAVKEIEDKVERIEQGGLTDAMEEAYRQITRSELNDHESEIHKKIDNVNLLLQNTDAEKLNESCKNLETVNKFMDDKVREQRLEDADRQRRQTNLVIFKVPESKAKEGTKRKEEDEEKVYQIMNEIEVASAPTRIIRLNKKGSRKQGSADDKIRPILVKFGSQFERDDTLRKFAYAKRQVEENDEENEEESEPEEKLFQSVSMKRDMTIQELREDSELFQEWKKKKDESKNLKDPYAHWIRKNGRVVNIGRYPTKGDQQMTH